MFKEIFDYIIYKLKDFVSSRLFPLCVVFLALFLILVVHLYNLQVIHGEDAQETYLTQKTLRTENLSPTRGNIYDRNGQLLAYNKLVYSVTLTDTGDYNGYEKNLMIIRLLEILDKHDESVISALPIYLDDNGLINYTSTNEAVIHGALRDVYGKRSYDEVIEDDDLDENLSAEGMFDLLYERYGIGLYGSNESDGSYKVSKADALRIINIRYLLSTNSYQRYKPVTIATDVKEDTMTEVLEKNYDLNGVDIKEDYKRTYENGTYFAHILGYTGPASAEDLEKFNGEDEGDDKKYVSGDIVGKTGVEAAFEQELQGEKGSRTMYLDSLGRILNVENETKPVTGNDVYLTIDSKLQIGIYHIIEQHLAGIILEKLDNAKVYNPPGIVASKRRLSIYECYYQMINNNILDLNKFKSDDAGDAQKRIYNAFLNGQDSAYERVRNELLSDNPSAYKDLDSSVPETEENFLKIYFSYCYDLLVESGYLIKDKIDTNDDMYIAYKTDETISLKEFLQYAMSKGWVDVSKLNLSDKYTGADDTYLALVDKIEELLKNSSTFSKKIYKNLIYNHYISECDIMLALYEQGVLKEDASAISSLNSQDSYVAFITMKDKINSLEITPAMLAMDPCSAACTIVDIHTGEVLASVSYPSYDNNRLSGNVDNNYYAKLVFDLSSPLYNTATQAQKAPGSVFKLVTTAAALEEGVVGTDEIVNAEGVFTKQGLNLACTYYTNNGVGHGPLTITKAIEQSCNYYFSEMGWRLSQVPTSNGDTTYNEPKGLKVLNEYASRFGLGETTGIELDEIEPHISDEAPIPSAIGQGTNVFSNIQLSRYVSTIANGGTIYKLTLLSKVTDKDGGILSKNSPQVVGQSEFSDTTWNAIHTGMRMVAKANEDKITCDVEIAGKTGTAEESKLRTNHANFISYAPYDNPEISMATTIIYGYSSANAVKVSSEVYDLYYGHLTLEDIISRGAKDSDGSQIID